MAIIKTLTFSDDNNGWTSLWDYEPSFAFSVRGNYYTIKDASVYEHYSSVTNNAGYYYGTYYPAEVTLILNDAVSTQKTFKTIGYEGSNGWEVTSVLSNEYSPTSNGYNPISVQDSAQAIKSYSDGLYLDTGVEYRSGFDLKEGKYFANLINNSVTLREGQVLEGEDISGVKGLFVSVTFKTDSNTRVGGAKQLFSVFSEYNRSFD